MKKKTLLLKKVIHCAILPLPRNRGLGTPGPMHTVSSQNICSLSFFWNQKVIKKINNQDHVGKNLSKDNSLEVYVVISQKNLSCTFFDKKTDKKQNERKS